MKKGNWVISKLGDVVDFQRGLTYSKRDEVDYSSNIVLRATNVDVNTSTLDLSELKYINEKIVIPKDKKVSKGSLIICTASGSKSHLGKVALIDDDYDYAFGGFMGQITPKQILDSKFLFYSLTSEAYKKYIDELSDGVNINNLRFDSLANFEIPIPPIPEQQRIVSVLDEAFASIAQAKSNAERNLVNARELYESVSGNLFIAYSDGWVIKRIGDVCSLYQGLAINQKSKHLLVPESNLPLLRIKDLRNNSAELYVKESGYPKNSLVKETDILYSRTGASLGMVFTGRRGILHNNSFKIAPNSMLDREYLFWWLQNPVFKKKIFGLASKTAQPDITHEIFKQQEIMIPPLAQQRAIVGRLEALSAETRRLEEIYQSKLEALEELKRSVLAKAFAGEL